MIIVLTAAVVLALLAIAALLTVLRGVEVTARRNAAGARAAERRADELARRNVAVECSAAEANARALAADRRAEELAPAPRIVGRTVVVHTRKPDDQSIRGVLVAEHVDRWTLREAVLLGHGGVEQALGGLEHIPVANIAWVQEIEVPAS